jgi:hypothetical protein
MEVPTIQLIPQSALMQTVFLIILMALGVTTTNAQKNPPAPRFTDQRFLHTGSDTFALLTEHQKQIIRVGTLILETELNEETITRVEHLLIDNNPPVRSDSFVLSRQSLRPFVSHKQSDHPRDLYFDDTSVRFQDADTSRIIRLRSRPYYAGSLDILLRCLPLKKGYSITLPVYSEIKSVVEKYTIKVTSRESLKTFDGGSCEVFVVQVKGGSVEGTYRMSVDNRALISFDNKFAHILRINGCSQ